MGCTRLVIATALLAGCGFDVPNAGTGGPSVGDDARPIDAPSVTADAAVDAPIDAAPPSGCIDRTITARKTYNPSSYQDGTLDPAPPYTKLILPSSLQVTYGNAGNHCAELTFKISDGSLVRCRYQGGSSLSSPTSTLNGFEIAKGLEYKFDQCRLGAACPMPNGTQVAILGSGVLLSSDPTPITLHIDNGDSKPLVTEVREGIRRCTP